MRCILHIDLDSFFASCEQQLRPQLRGRPVGVCGDPKGRSVISAASREAKKFGVKSGTRIPEALTLCPALILIKGNSGLYAAVSRKARTGFAKYGLNMETASIDEVFLDATPIAPRYGGVKPMVARLKAELAQTVGEWVTCSVGVAWNKPLAKLASDLDKPNGLAIITPENLSAVLERVKLADFAGIGRATEAGLRRLGIESVAQLQKISRQRLRLIFGQKGEWLWGLVRGLGSDRVISDIDRPAQKSLGHEETFPRDLDWPACAPPLQMIAEKVAYRLRRHNLAGNQLTLTIRYHNFATQTFRTAIGWPTFDGAVIAKAANRLFGRAVNKNKLVRLLGISIGNLMPAEKISAPLFNEWCRPALLKPWITSTTNTAPAACKARSLSLMRPMGLKTALLFSAPKLSGRVGRKKFYVTMGTLIINFKVL